MANYQMDDIDRAILFALIRDARTPYLEIARQCGVSGAAIHQRVSKLENAGIITGSRLQVKPSALGLNVCAFVSIVVSEPGKCNEVVAAFKKVPEIVECHYVTGTATMLLKLYCEDNEHLMEVMLHRIQKTPYLQGSNTMISLEEAFERQVWVKEYDRTGFSESEE